MLNPFMAQEIILKLTATLAFLSCFSLTAVTAQSEETVLKGCAAKRQALTQQIEQAHSAGNLQQEAGLQKALKENQRHCTDASLTKDRQKRLAKAQREVTEREADLKKAEAKGDTKKIDKRKEKLGEAQKELADAQAAINQ
jgi:hypothetical protein